MKCDKCGKEFKPGNRPSGVPNGVGFVLADGTEITICAECIESFTTDEGREWLDKLKEEHNL